MNDSGFNLLQLTQIIKKWWKAIFVVCLLAVIGSFVITLPQIMPPHYESIAVFYPSNPSLADRQNLFRLDAGDFPVEIFGKEEDLDRLMTIAKSSKLAGYIINKHNLLEHYEIDPDAKYPLDEVNDQFEENYKPIKNEYGAIEIHVWDTDRNLAATIANDIVDHIDLMNNQMVQNNKMKVLDMFRNQIKKQKITVRLLTDSLVGLQKDFTEAGSSIQKARLQEFSTVLKKEKENAVKNLNKLVTLYGEYEAASDEGLSGIYTIEEAYPAEKKARPVRWLIILTSLIIAFAVTTLTVVILEKN